MFGKKAYENMMDIQGGDARQELEKELCIGTTASPTPECMAVNGEAIGFPLLLTGGGGALQSGWDAVVDKESGDTYYRNKKTGKTTWEKPITKNELGTVMETSANRTLSDDHNKMIRDYACTDWDKSNFKKWECVNCWICGLPLWWAGEGKKSGYKAPPEGEHKVQIGWMAAFGAGPITKLLMAKKNDEDDAEAVEGSQISTRTWSITRKALLHDQRFLDWKRNVRGEGYAWSHRYCNREKNAYSTVKLTCDLDGNLKYYLNWEGIKYIAHRISRHRNQNVVGRDRKMKMDLWFPSHRPDMYNDRNKQFMAALKMLKQTAEEGTGFEGGKRTRYWNWGAEYMYNNMVKQLLPLVTLLNKSFPNIGVLNLTTQEKIRHTIRLNYKRLVKTFGARRMQSGSNTLETFFKNIMKTDSSSNDNRYKYLNKVFQFSLQNLRGGGKDENIKKLMNGDDNIKLKGKDMVELLPDLPNVGTFSNVLFNIDFKNLFLPTIQTIEEQEDINDILAEHLDGPMQDVMSVRIPQIDEDPKIIARDIEEGIIELDEDGFDDELLEEEIEHESDDDTKSIFKELVTSTIDKGPPPSEVGSPLKTVQQEEKEDLDAFFTAYNSNDDVTAFQPPEDCFQHPECMTVEEYEVLADHFFNYLQGKYKDVLFGKEAPSQIRLKHNGRWSQEAIDRLKKIERHMFQREGGKYINTTGIRDRRLYNIFAVKCDADKMKKLKLNRCIFHNHPHITEQQEWIPTRAQWKQVQTLYKDEVMEAVKKRNVTEICNTIRDYLFENHKKKLETVSDVEIVKQVLDPRQINLNYNKNRVKIQLSRDFANYIKLETGYTNGRSKYIYNHIFGPYGKVTLFNRSYYPEKKKVATTPPLKHHEDIDKKDPTPAGRRGTTKEKEQAWLKKRSLAGEYEEGSSSIKKQKRFCPKCGRQIWDETKVSQPDETSKTYEDRVWCVCPKAMDTSHGGKKKKRKKRTKKRRRRKKKTRRKRKKKRTKKKKRKRKKRTRRRR